MEPNRLYNSAYVPARRQRELPIPPVQQPKKKKKISREAKKNRERAMAISPMYMCALAIAVIATLMICVSFLTLESEVRVQAQAVTQKEKELNKLLDENSATKERLNASMDANYIYKVAKKELGMDYAKENQVIYYQSSKPDYIKQYKEIPKAE